MQNGTTEIGAKGRAQNEGDYDQGHTFHGGDNLLTWGERCGGFRAEKLGPTIPDRVKKRNDFGKQLERV